MIDAKCWPTSETMRAFGLLYVFQTIVGRVVRSS